MGNIMEVFLLGVIWSILKVLFGYDMFIDILLVLLNKNLEIVVWNLG